MCRSGAGVRYVDLYPGVDLEFTSEGGQMVQRLAAQPDADFGAVLLRVEGADAVATDAAALRLSTSVGVAIWPLLRAGALRSEATVQSHGTQTFDVTAPYAQTYSSQQSVVVATQSNALLYGTFLGASDQVTV